MDIVASLGKMLQSVIRAGSLASRNHLLQLR
jgi:hypothetical protein